ncbi:hypothetical protein ACWERJ_32435, partial [Streptomyces sp. NPDC004050]
PVFRRVIEEIRDALARQSTFLNELGGRREPRHRIPPTGSEPGVGEERRPVALRSGVCRDPHGSGGPLKAPR